MILHFCHPIIGYLIQSVFLEEPFQIIFPLLNMIESQLQSFHSHIKRQAVIVQVIVQKEQVPDCFLIRLSLTVGLV